MASTIELGDKDSALIFRMGEEEDRIEIVVPEHKDEELVQNSVIIASLIAILVETGDPEFKDLLSKKYKELIVDKAKEDEDGIEKP